MSSSIFFKNKNKGFTLIELIVVMSIAMVVMTSLVIQQSKWNDNLAVSTQAYEMALMIRQARVFALAVWENTAGTGDKFDVAYGVDFDIDNPTWYVFFVDKPPRNQKYDVGEEIETKTLTRGVTINKICAFIPPKEKCSDLGSLNEIPIIFFRPSLNASSRFLSSSGGDIASFGPPAFIYLVSPQGKTFFVKVEANGQVSISQFTP